MNLNKNRILILGANGYIGCALYFYLKDKDYEVLGVDNSLRENNIRALGGESLIASRAPAALKFDISIDYNELKEVVQSYRPGTIINLAQQPSAPFSMIDAQHATDTQRNNVNGAMNVLWAVKEIDPNIHIIQLGTAGEYPDWLYEGVEVPEGSRIKVDYQGKEWEIPTPRYAGSWYHFSKLYSSFNADYACRIWKLRISDVNQGIVYGGTGDTRFDYDEHFGTVVNRFITQAVLGMPLTIYGRGLQERSFINLKNSLQAIELMLKKPPSEGEYRIVQQLTEVYKIIEIANMVYDLTGAKVQYLESPRAEMYENKFKFEAKKLKDLGLKTIAMHTELPKMMNLIKGKKDKIKKELIMPKTKWI